MTNSVDGEIRVSFHQQKILKAFALVDDVTNKANHREHDVN